jgi:hypothetical protein
MAVSVLRPRDQRLPFGFGQLLGFGTGVGQQDSSRVIGASPRVRGYHTRQFCLV